MTTKAKTPTVAQIQKQMARYKKQMAEYAILVKARHKEFYRIRAEAVSKVWAELNRRVSLGESFYYNTMTRVYKIHPKNIDCYRLSKGGMIQVCSGKNWLDLWGQCFDILSYRLGLKISLSSIAQELSDSPEEPQNPIDNLVPQEFSKADWLKIREIDTGLEGSELESMIGYWSNAHREAVAEALTCPYSTPPCQAALADYPELTA